MERKCAQAHEDRTCVLPQINLYLSTRHESSHHFAPPWSANFFFSKIDSIYKKESQRGVKTECPRDGSGDRHGGACYLNVTSSDSIVTACCVQHEQSWVPCWTEVLFVSRIWELWATTCRTHTYTQIPASPCSPACRSFILSLDDDTEYRSRYEWMSIYVLWRVISENKMIGKITEITRAPQTLKCLAAVVLCLPRLCI